MNSQAKGEVIQVYLRRNVTRINLIFKSLPCIPFDLNNYITTNRHIKKCQIPYSKKKEAQIEFCAQIISTIEVVLQVRVRGHASPFTWTSACLVISIT